MSAELVFLAGRTWLLRQPYGAIEEELAWTAWRVPFLALYYWLFRGYLAPRIEQRGMPRHPMLAAALLLTLAGVGFHGPRVVEYQLVLAATTPVIGLREELVYRVILQGYLERYMTPLRAVLLASAIFTAYHIGSQPMNAVSVTGIFAAGIVLGVIYQRTRNLWLVAALHAGIDVVYAIAPPLSINAGTIFICNLLGAMWAIVWWRIDLNAPGTGVRPQPGKTGV
jgi:membrane protease YdiL (CAAX protease family)